MSAPSITPIHAAENFRFVAKLAYGSVRIGDDLLCDRPSDNLPKPEDDFGYKQRVNAHNCLVAAFGESDETKRLFFCVEAHLLALLADEKAEVSFVVSSPAAEEAYAEMFRSMNADQRDDLRELNWWLKHRFLRWHNDRQISWDA